MQRLLIGLAVVALTFSGAVSSARAQADGPGRHVTELTEHAGQAPGLTGDEPVGADRGRVPAVERDVLGFYPYWLTGFDGLRWDLLTSIAYFGAEVDAVAADGTLGDLHGWGTTTDALIASAHAEGVRVLLTVTLFDGSAISSILGDASKRATLVAELLALVESAGGDGVVVDFEGVPGGATNKTGLVDFVTALTDALHGALPGSRVRVATPAVDWQGVFDYDQLAIHTDGLIIMAYDYHWQGGDPGPVAPLTSGTTWGPYNLNWTVADYVTFGGTENRDRFFLGVPWYGYDWPSTDLTIPGTATANATARVFSAAKAIAADSGASWDADSQTPFVLRDSGGPRQLFYDDGESLAAKLELVESEQLGGIAIWALNYEGDETEPWTAIEDAFVPICADADGDGHADALCGGDDCDDADPSVFPGAAEICEDGIDNDCDGGVDEGCDGGGCQSAQAAVVTASGSGDSRTLGSGPGPLGLLPYWAVSFVAVRLASISRRRKRRLAGA